MAEIFNLEDYRKKPPEEPIFLELAIHSSTLDAINQLRDDLGAATLEEVIRRSVEILQTFQPEEDMPDEEEVASMAESFSPADIVRVRFETSRRFMNLLEKSKGEFDMNNEQVIMGALMVTAELVERRKMELNFHLFLLKQLSLKSSKIENYYAFKKSRTNSP